MSYEWALRVIYVLFKRIFLSYKYTLPDLTLFYHSLSFTECFILPFLVFHISSRRRIEKIFYGIFRGCFDV